MGALGQKTEVEKKHGSEMTEMGEEQVEMKKMRWYPFVSFQSKRVIIPNEGFFVWGALRSPEMEVLLDWGL